MSVPLAELHVHLEATARPALVRRLAQRNGLEIPPATIDGAVNTAFLVERERIDDFSRAVGELGRELEGRVRLRYVGPLPPYSFTGDIATAGAA